MALKLKYTDEHGILHINMSPSSTPKTETETETETKTEITDPKFDTINNRFGQYDLFGGKYEVESGACEKQSLFRSRYNSIEEELANTPYAFATERSFRVHSAEPVLDITIQSRSVTDDASPSKDIEDDRFFTRSLAEYDLFGPQIDLQTSIKTSDEESPAFTVTQLIHAQDRYFDLSSRQSVFDSPVKSERTQVRTEVKSARVKGGAENEAFKILGGVKAKEAASAQVTTATTYPVVPTSKRKRESSFAIITSSRTTSPARSPAASRPGSPRSLPVGDLETRSGRSSPFKGRGFREATSRHATPKTSAANSRSTSPFRGRTESLSRIDNMATAALPPPIPLIHNISRPHSPRNFVKENIEEVRELSELNREQHEAEAEQKRVEEEEALLKEMGLLDKNAKSDAIRSIVCSRATSRSNSPSKVRLRSRSNSPSGPTAILRFENIPSDSEEFINLEDGMPKRSSRVRTASKSQPPSNDGSPKHSKIPKRQSSVSPARRNTSNSKKPIENNLSKNQRFISNSTSSIHETIRIGGSHEKKGISKSTLSISPAHIKSKPPISPGRGGPPPSNRAINAKRLSPIVGTPNKSPVEDLKSNSVRTTPKPSPITKKPVKTAGSTPVTSRVNSKQPNKPVGREPSPDKRRNLSRPVTVRNTSNNVAGKPVVRATSTRLTTKPMNTPKVEPKKPINRTSSMKSLVRTPSTKTLNEKPPILKKKDSKKDLRAQSNTKINEVGMKKESPKPERKPSAKVENEKPKTSSAKVNKKEVEKESEKEIKTSETETATASEGVTTQDSHTQYDKIINDKGELVILTKKSIVSMTTAAITSQPLEIVTTVTNQLPAALEKAREKAILERNSSKDSLAPKEEEKDAEKANKDKTDEDKKIVKPKSTVFNEENVKFKPLLPPYNNPQVERAKQKIDNILKSPEVSTENIISTSPVFTKPKETKATFKHIADKTKTELKESKEDTTALTAATLKAVADAAMKDNQKIETESEGIRSEAMKIVDSIITPVEEPKPVELPKVEDIKEIEPIVMVVNEKKPIPDKSLIKSEVIEKMTETLVKGEPEVEVQSSNMSSPGQKIDKMAVQNKMAEGSESDKSQSNGGFPQSTSTTPKPPARTKRDSKELSKSPNASKETTPDTFKEKKPNICSRLMGKCKTKCCPCCIKPEDDEEREITPEKEEKGGMMSKLNCCKKKDVRESSIETVGKSTIQYESETKPKRKLRDVMCGCCSSKRRVSDVSDVMRRDERAISEAMRHDEQVATEAGCCGKRQAESERRDSILSDRQPNSCCNNRLARWFHGACRRSRPEPSVSRRQSMFSKNKSLSPTLPPEDTRSKLDPTLVEHTSVMRAAIPVLPLPLAYLCLFCNIIVPGLGTIFSGMFCLCFGIPRFGVYDGAKQRIGAFVINLLVGAGQLFTVLFCLVGWGWSIWWGVIMVRLSRKKRKLKAEAAAEEAEAAAAPPVTANNHTRA